MKTPRLPERSRAQIIELRELFPPSDPIAPTIARLCILQEDLRIEIEGMLAGKIGALDGNSEDYRKLYFFRRYILTLQEIRSALETLRKSNFKKTLSRISNFQKKYDEILGDLRKSEELIKSLRNLIGGHVQENHIKETLDKMHIGRKIVLSISETTGSTRYRWSGDIIIASLVDDEPDSNQDQKLNNILKEILGEMKIKIIWLIHNIFLGYLSDRKILG